MIGDFLKFLRTSVDGKLWANTQGMCTSFKTELLLGAHQFGAVTLVSRTSLTAPTKDTFKFALFLTSASRGVGDTVYNTTGEVSSAGGYPAGGVAVTNGTDPQATGTTAFWQPSAPVSFGVVTLSVAFNCALLYNFTQGAKAVAVFTFGDQTVTGGTFTLTMPSLDATNALIRIA